MRSIYFDLLNPVGIIDMVFIFLATSFTCGYSRLTTSWFDVVWHITQFLKGLKVKYIPFLQLWARALHNQKFPSAHQNII